MAGAGEAASYVAAASLPHTLLTALASLGHRAGLLWQHAFSVQPAPPRSLVLGSAAIALGVVAFSRFWRIARTVVTIVHEGGHAVAAIATGQRLAGIRLYRNTAGETRTAGRAGSPGRAFIAAAGYPAPALLGLGAAALLTVGHLTGMLLLSLLLLAAIAVTVRNAYGILAVLLTAAAIAAICLYTAPQVQAWFAYALTWFLLLGAVRPVFELARQRRRDRDQRSDADQLARLTPLPGWAWVTIFALTTIAALAVGVRWLIP